jgi:hypothetical protein
MKPETEHMEAVSTGAPDRIGLRETVGRLAETSGGDLSAPTTSPVLAQRVVQQQCGSYASALDAFLDAMPSARGPRRVAAIFHAVRRMRYASRGSRSPLTVLERREGSCTGKHLLLRDLLRRAGEAADVEIVEGDFARGLPVVDTMSEPLRRWVRDGGIRDYHNCIMLYTPTGILRLDATWHDALEPLGFPVNARWAGEGETTIALKPDGFRIRVEDVIREKERLVGALSEKERADRRAFLTLLTDWIDENT